MPGTQMSNERSTQLAIAAKVEMKLEVVVLPVPETM